MLPARQYLEQLKSAIESDLEALQNAIDGTTAGKLNTKVTNLETFKTEASAHLDEIDSDIAQQNETIEALRTEFGEEMFAENKVLWTGAYYMSNGQNAPLSEPVQSQKNGIVLIWSHYNPNTSVIENAGFNIFFIPKWFVKTFSGGGVECNCSDYGTLTRKYVYVSNENIAGNAANVQNNGKYQVLRAVIGV